ncbi:MAG: flavin reductase family protein, partial [Pseudonocardiaceae bacterium]
MGSAGAGGMYQPDDSLSVTPDDFRTLMSVFPTGVAVVTTLGQDGSPQGMTCSALASVTPYPPTLLVCLR